MRGGPPVRSCLDKEPPGPGTPLRRDDQRARLASKERDMSVKAILDTHPRALIADLDVLAGCVDECGECAAICTVCADACLAEDDVRALVRCTRLCLDCADACPDAGRILAEECRRCERACEEMLTALDGA